MPAAYGPPGSLVAGLDLGSTGLKILIADEGGHEILTHQVSTPWRAGEAGTTDLHGADLDAALLSLLRTAATKLDAIQPSGRIGAIAISGMGETGFVLDESGRPMAPGMAWFDPRGAAEAAALPASLASEFGGRTGLPLGAQVSIAKLIHLRDKGIDLTRARWVNLPEYVVARLGGAVVAEISLTARTGLLDQDTLAPWQAMLEYLGVTREFVPPIVAAGTCVGHAEAQDVPEAFRGARIAIAGHDHLVAVGSSGALDPDAYLVSLGTAEVLLRIIDSPMSFGSRMRLAELLINCVPHTTPGQYAVVAGVKTGLLMRRALQMSGISDREGRDALDRAAYELPLEGSLPAGAIEISGARNDDGVLRMAVRSDGLTPAEIFNAVLRHGNDEISRLLHALDQELPPATSTVLTGGWARMRSVHRARAAVLPRLSTSEREQDTAYGAVRCALSLLDRPVPAPQP